MTMSGETGKCQRIRPKVSDAILPDLRFGGNISPIKLQDSMYLLLPAEHIEKS